MKIVKTLILSLCWIQSFSQNIDSIFSKNNLPDDLVVVIKKEIGTLGFPKPYTSIVTFKYAGTSVDYYAFKYEPSDSIAFRNAEEKRWMASGCNVVFNKDPNKNFPSITKDGYYFVLQYCYCRTGENENCAELAKRINEYIKR